MPILVTGAAGFIGYHVSEALLGRGELVVLEARRRLPDFKHLVYASSSSVYRGNIKLPFAVD